MTELQIFKSLNFITIGSNYFFSGFKDYVSHDIDYGTFYDNFNDSILKKYGDTCKTNIDGNDYFIWKKMDPEKLINIAFKKDPMSSGKYLIPEICKQVGFTINHLKKLKKVFKNMDCKHRYETIIYNAYIKNNDFILTDSQLQEAYDAYKVCREFNKQKSLYKNKKLKWIIYFNRPNKCMESNAFGRDKGMLGSLLISEEERSVAVDTYYLYKRYYPEVYAYECVNYDVFSDGFLRNNFNFNLDGDTKVVDIDIKGPYSNDSIDGARSNTEEYIKDFLLKRNIHSDLQRSPRGIHIIVNRKDLDAFCYLKELLAEKYRTAKRSAENIRDFRSAPLLDVITNVKLLDGIDIGGFKIKTIKNWT